MSKAIERIKTKAEQLAETRLLIAKTEEAHRVELEGMKAKRDTLQDELLAELRKEGLTSIKTDGGESYTRATRRGINITNPITALAWAKDHGAVAIDRRLVGAKLAKATVMPTGFELVENEYISVRKPKADKADEVDNDQSHA
jgi:hypothetical protein